MRPWAAISMHRLIDNHVISLFCAGWRRRWSLEAANRTSVPWLWFGFFDLVSWCKIQWLLPFHVLYCNYSMLQNCNECSVTELHQENLTFFSKDHFRTLYLSTGTFNTIYTWNFYIDLILGLQNRISFLLSKISHAYITHSSCAKSFWHNPSTEIVKWLSLELRYMSTTFHYHGTTILIITTPCINIMSQTLCVISIMPLHIANYKLQTQVTSTAISATGNSSPVAASPTLMSCRSSVLTDTVTGIAASPSSTRDRVTYPASSSTLYRSSSYRTVTPKGKWERAGWEESAAQECMHA